MAELQHQGACYLNLLFDKSLRSLNLTKAVKRLEKYSDRFDAFVGTGVSGTVAASMLAVTMNKGLLIVRKHTDKDNHSGNSIEGAVGIHNDARYCFIDDLIATGQTLGRVKRAIAEHGKIVGIYVTNDGALFEPALQAVGIDYKDIFTSSRILNADWKEIKQGDA